MILWRISNYGDLNGLGGLKSAGRWHNKGVPIVYLAESPALAMLETLVHLDLSADEIPDQYQLLEVEYAQRKSVSRLSIEHLPEKWVDDPYTTRTYGDQWLASGSSALLKVPSALVPRSFNFLLNPRHPEAKAASVISSTRHIYDGRLVL